MASESASHESPEGAQHSTAPDPARSERKASGRWREGVGVTYTESGYL